ncbi:phage major capsid protein [Coralliovum pocilloporae]|uniref:phage major capsid protein n=1 Tax=Coralliovum pocilloporae TaxID=3066369 RepID=UPI003306AA58
MTDQTYPTRLETPVPLETKSGHSASDLTDAFDEFMTSFEAFKDANDERLQALETRMTSDPLTDEKVNRINTALDEQKRAMDHLILKAGRPARAGGDRPWSPALAEHKTAFERYVRSGSEQGLHQLEEKALSAGSDPDGGYLVPDEVETEIGRRLTTLSPIRAISSVRQVSSSVYKKPFATTGPATGWVAETAVRPQTATPTLAELQFPVMELYAMPAATSTLLDDSAVNIDQWIADEVQIAFAEQEGEAFVKGDGVNKPRGFLDYTTVDESGWSWGNIGTIATGADGDFASSSPSDVLIDTIYALKAGYRQNGNWVMNRSTQAAVRKLKDADGNYLWQPPAQAGGQASLMNFPLVEAEDMPDIASDATAIAFGDFRRGYLIIDRLGVRILRDPYSSKPYVLFYTTKRVGGGVQDFDAIKLVKFGTS